MIVPCFVTVTDFTNLHITTMSIRALVVFATVAVATAFAPISLNARSSRLQFF